MTMQLTSEEQRAGFIPRRVLIVGYSYDSPQVATQVAAFLAQHNIESDIISHDPWNDNPSDESQLGIDEAHSVASHCDMVLVLGGDGSFLRGADLAHGADVPMLGINMGHVGFLAESELSGLWEALDRVIEGDFICEDRMTVDIDIVDDKGEPISAHEWAINEVSLEKNTHRGILEATIAVDNRPVSGYVCDGIFVSTPTGSTAYSFSAGGPVLWPELEAMLVIPNNAHGLFTRPLVVSPNSIVTIDVNVNSAAAIAYLDGYRSVTVNEHERIVVRRGSRPIRMVRLDKRPFADKLVRKFHLPVKGWRAPLPVVPPTDFSD